MEKLASILTSGILISVLTLSSCRIVEEQDLIDRKVNGVIIKLKSLGRDAYEIEIKDRISMDTLRYDLLIRDFIETNKIQVNDSIGKDANSKIISFYRKTDVGYLKIDNLNF